MNRFDQLFDRMAAGVDGFNRGMARAATSELCGDPLVNEVLEQIAGRSRARRETEVVESPGLTTQKDLED